MSIYRRNVKSLLATILCVGILLSMPVNFAASNTAYADGESTETVTAADSMQQIAFTEDTSQFINPERGWYYGFTTDSTDGIEDLRKQGISVVLLETDLGDFKSTPISPAKLAEISKAFDQARKYGLEVMFRAAYDLDGQTGCEPEDLSTITGHIAQLKSIFDANEDILYCVQAGFLGPWGEWHDSYYGDPPSLAAQKAVLSALMDAVPESRCILVRRPMFIRGIYAGAPGGNVLTDGTAFNGSDLSRTGYHDDALLSTDDENGTYVDPAYSTPAELDWVNQQDKYVPFAAESDSNTSYSDPSDQVVEELNKLHAQVINNDYDTDVLTKWKDPTGKGQSFYNEKGQSFYNYLSTYLGYRFVIKSAEINTQILKGGFLHLNLSIQNEGFANLSNARDVEIVLSNGSSTYTAKVNDDPRKWYKENGVMTKDLYFSIPSDTPTGTWSVYLNLPNASASTSDDPAQNPAKNPAYSIRLANTGVWVANKGYNLIKSGIVIDTANLANSETTFRQISQADAALLTQRMAFTTTAPAPLSAEAVAYNSIKLSWGAVPAAAGYELYRSTSASGTYSLQADTQVNSFTDNTSVAVGTKYCYTVRAYCLVGTAKVFSPYSAMASAQTALAVPPSLKATPLTYNSILLNWGAVQAADGYELYRSTSASGTYSLQADTKVNSFNDNTSVAVGTKYYYTVKAYFLLGTQKVYSDSSVIVTALTSLAMPSPPKATPLTYNSIKVSWGTVPGATSYELLRATSSTGVYSLRAITKVPYNTDSGVNTGTVYYYKVRACRLVGSTTARSVSSAIISSRTKLNVPATVKAAGLSSTSIKVSWGAVPGVSKYELWRCTASATGKYLLVTTLAGTSYVNVRLNSKTVYYYKIRAYRLVVGKIVYGAFSAVVHAKP